MPAADISKPGLKPHFTYEEGPNPSLVLDWTSGNLDWVERTVNGITYRKTFTWSAGGDLIAVSVWVKQP